MPNIQEQLAALLERIDRPGDFYATGTLDMHPPRLRVEGIGTIALPLLPVQASQLIEVAEQAPYGRGSETLVDTEVRRTWQIDAARLSLAGQRWQEGFNEMYLVNAERLGVLLRSGPNFTSCYTSVPTFRARHCLVIDVIMVFAILGKIDLNLPANFSQPPVSISDWRLSKNVYRQTCFSQLTEHLPLPIFRRCVARYNGNRKIKTFSCLDQFLCMIFAQLTYRESFRDIETT